MTAERRAAVWIMVLVAVGLVLYLLRDMLLPFVAGMALAYLLDPFADWLEARGLSRLLATALITGVFVLVAAALLLWLVPLLTVQVLAFVQNVPGMVETAREHVLPLVDSVVARLGFISEERLQAAATEMVQRVAPWLVEQIAGVWQSGLALFHLLSLLVITPIVAFYFILDWDRLKAQLDSLLPRANAAVIRAQVREIDRTLAGFARGQALVCALLAAGYATALSLIGLEFGIVVGVGAGLVSFIPLVGALSGFVVGVGLAVLQFDSWVPIAMVAAVFAMGQAVEGNLLTPRLVGDRVRLHPVWMMFAMLAGATLFGFVGVLLAVPAAAVIGVMVRFAILRYRDSRLFHGDGGAP